jgi:predicted RNA polymerase sigma factor
MGQWLADGIPASPRGWRITRAKHVIADGGAELTMPEPGERAARIAAVLQVIS